MGCYRCRCPVVDVRCEDFDVHRRRADGQPVHIDWDVHSEESVSHVGDGEASLVHALRELHGDKAMEIDHGQVWRE